jgi:hypothetical protein
MSEGVRGLIHRALGLGLAAGVLAGCGGTTSPSGASGVTVTREEREAVGSLCAIEGHATNVGNLRVTVTLRYEARDATGAVIGTSTAFFQIAPFSDFDFGPRKANHLGQPSSGTFTNGLSCSAISSFRRVDVDVTDA